MKKITLLLAAFFVAIAVQAQEAEIVLTQTEGGPGNQGVACGEDSPNPTYTGDNAYFREYNLDDHGITEPVSVVGAEFGVATATNNIGLMIHVFEYIGFPEGFDVSNLPQAITSQGFEVTPDNTGEIVKVVFDEPVTVDPGATLIIGIFEPAHGNGLFYLGTGDSETKSSFLASEACGIFQPVEVGTIGFASSMHIINLVVDTELSTNDVLAGNVAVYPNPTSDVFNIDLPKGVEVVSSSLVDVMGRTTGVQYIDGQMNVSALAKGVYFLNIDTNQGSFTQKVVKQ